MEKEEAGAGEVKGGDDGSAEREPWFGKEEEKGIKKGCSPGRIINGFIAFNFFLVFLTAIIVSGTLGVLNNELSKNYPDHKVNRSKTCILYTECVTAIAPNGTKLPDLPCQVEYNDSGTCDFISAGFGFIALFALVYIGICVVRIVLSTTIWWTVVGDVVCNIAMLLWVMLMGIIISIGLAVTCTNVNKHYLGSGVSNCSARRVPTYGNYSFYSKVNSSQGAAWFCFLFLFISMVIFIVRSAIMCRRKAKIPAMPENKEILTAEDKPV